MNIGQLNLHDFNCVPLNINHGSQDIEEILKINRFLIDPLLALKYETNNVFKTFILVDIKKGKIVGFYSLCVGSKRVFKEFKKLKSLPTVENNKELPTVELIWFGIDNKYQGQKLGTALMENVFQTAYDISKRAGVSFLAVNSLKRTKKFYEKLNFFDLGIPHKLNESLWMGVTIKEIKIAINK